MQYTIDYDGNEWINGEWISPYMEEWDAQWVYIPVDMVVDRDADAVWREVFDPHFMPDPPPASARARGHGEAIQLSRRLYSPGCDSKRGYRKPHWETHGCVTWKYHRPYQEHGRKRLPRRVDVIDALNGMVRS